MDNLSTHIDWLRDKIVHTPYTSHDDDPLMCLIFELELKRRNINLTIEQVNTIVNLKRSISHHLGDFWQRVLGDAPGWENLGVGDATGCDLRNEELRIVIELKNKLSTLNSSSKSAVITKLAKQQKKGYTAVLGIINDKNGKDKVVDESGVRMTTGDKLIHLVYGSVDVMTTIYDTICATWVEYCDMDNLASEFMAKAMVNE